MEFNILLLNVVRTNRNGLRRALSTHWPNERHVAGHEFFYLNLECNIWKLFDNKSQEKCKW